MLDSPFAPDVTYSSMIDKNRIYAGLNNGMLEERGESFRINLEKNLTCIELSGGLRNVTGLFSGKHVVIIGAGPSLDRNLPLLKKYSSRLDIVYLAADMALKPLVLYGVRPHFVITCETTPSDFFSGIQTADMHLLAFSCSSSSNLRKWKGKISFYNWMIEGDVYTSLWDRAGRGLGSVATGSIVTTQAVSIVLGCSVASAALAGNDMGFYDRFYASGTVSSEKMFLKSGRFNPEVNIGLSAARRARSYEVRRGDAVYYTNNQFLAAKYWLEELFGKSPFPVVDCSEPGCSDKVVTKMELRRYFESIDKSAGRGKRR